MHNRRLIACLTLIPLAAAIWAQGNTAPKLSVVAPAHVTAGSNFKATANLTFAPGLHGYQNPPSEDYMIPVTASLQSQGFKLVKAHYPLGEDLQVGGEDKPVKMYSGTIAIALDILAPSKPGSSKLAVNVNYQQCNATSCFAPADVQASSALVIDPAKSSAKPLPIKEVQTPATVKVQAPPAKATTTPSPTKEKQSASPLVIQPNPVSITGDDARRPPPAALPSTEEPKTGLAGLLQGAFQSHNYWLIVPLLFLAGLVINLTPCVYPMIPVTLTFFANQSAGSTAGKAKLGFMYMLGIAAMYGTLGGVAAFFGSTFGSLFENRWFLITLAVLMVALALSMFDVYQIGIPAPLARQLKGRSGSVGALIMGLMVGVAAAPCAGPLVVAILAEIAKLKSVGAGVGLFILVGLGLGLPYMVLGTLSIGAKSLPKAGGWMKTVKSLLGLLVIGLGLSYFLQAFARDLGADNTLYVWIAFYLLSAAYLVFFENGGTTRAVFGIKGTALLFFGILAGTSYQEHSQQLKEERFNALSGGTALASKINWQPFTLTAFESAKSSGKVIVIDGAADWCVQCHELDDRVFAQPESVVAMRNVLSFKIDWSTGVDPHYKDMTAKLFNIKGLPHVEILKPGGERSEERDSIQDPADLIQSLKKAGAQP